MIEVGRNSIVIRNVNLKSQEFKKFHSAFSLYDKAIFKYTFSAYTIIDNDIYIPSSVDIDTIKNYFPNKDVIINYKTTSKAGNISIIMKHQPKNELQKKAISFLMKMKTDDENRSRFLSLQTGSGKTYIAINVILQLQKKAMIVVDSLSLAEQWKDKFLDHTNINKDDIKILSGKESIESAIKNPNGKIYIAIHRTLGNLLLEDTNYINKLMNKLEIGVRVFDEAHVEFESICKINSLSNVQFTIYLTATPTRSNFNDKSLYAKIFGKIPYYNGEGVEKYHTVIIYPINTNPSIDIKASVRTRYGFSMGKWANYLATDAYDKFLEEIVAIFDKFKLTERKKKTAIILPTLELLEKLYNDLSYLYPDIEFGKFIGSIKKDKRSLELEKMFFLTDDKMFDKAIDVPDLEILINCTSFSSTVKTEQIIGRLRYGENKNSILIDVVDFGFTECINQFKIRKRFYKKKAKKIIEIKK